jgi:hypothetical protein
MLRCQCLEREAADEPVCGQLLLLVGQLADRQPQVI